LRTQVKTSVEREPVERCVAGQHLKAGADVGALLLEIGGVGEEVDACAQVELSSEGRGEVEANASQACLRGEADLRERMKVLRFGYGWGRNGHGRSGLTARA